MYLLWAGEKCAIIRGGKEGQDRPCEREGATAGGAKSQTQKKRKAPKSPRRERCGLLV